MTVINLASPFAMKNATLEFGADDFTQAVSQAELQPSVTTSKFTSIGGHVVQGVDPASWVLALNIAQDDDPAGLSRYLLLHEGEEVVTKLTPVEGGTVWTQTVIVTPGNIGGTAGADLAQGTVNLPVIGRPVPTDPTP